MAGYGGDSGAGDFGQLSGEGANPSRCAVDQDMLSRLDARDVMQSLIRGECCQGHRAAVLASRLVGRRANMFDFTAMRSAEVPCNGWNVMHDVVSDAYIRHCSADFEHRTRKV